MRHWIAAAFLFGTFAFAPAELRAGSTMAKLSSVVDGNTLVVTLRGEPVKVRLHGVAVPPADEKRPILNRLNQETTAFLKKYLGTEGWLYLEFPDGNPTPDKDGYVPAFVYHGTDATFVNEKLVAEGLAIVNRKERNQFTDAMIKKEGNAKAMQRGIWGSFANGGGEKIASGGTIQGNYIGVAANDAGQGSYVSYWIVLFY